MMSRLAAWITVLFVASFVFPLLLPQGLRMGVLWRVCIAITLFQAAYLAEVVRGGLQALPRGQHEAAASLGLGFWQTQAQVILPQALVLVIPSFVNSLLSTFMDTSLVTVVSASLVYTLLGTLAGLFASWALARWIKTLLYGIAVHDPVSFSVPAVVLVAAGLLASLLPMYRAVRVDPAQSLREG